MKSKDELLTDLKSSLVDVLVKMEYDFAEEEGRCWTDKLEDEVRSNYNFESIDYLLELVSAELD